MNVIIRYDDVFNLVNVWLVKQNPDGSQTCVLPMNLEATTYTAPGTVPPPTIRIEGTFATQFLQDLADGLAAAGFRPAELKASDREVTAIKVHLEDMRRLVFEALAPPEFPPQLPKR